MSKIETAKKVGEFMIHFAKKNLPSIMSVCGGIGVVVTTGLAIKETPKAMEKIEAKKVKDPDISALEMVAVAVPEYAPALIAFAITEGLIFGANHINLKRIAALGALYTGVCADKETKEKALKALEEIVGKEKVEEIKKKVIAESAVEEHIPVSTTEVIKGRSEKRPCRLVYFNKQIGGVFYNSYDGIERAMSDVEEEARTNGVAKFSTLMKRLNMNGGYYIEDLLVLDEDMDYLVYAATIDGAAGWEISLETEPLIDYDARLKRATYSVD